MATIIDELRNDFLGYVYSDNLEDDAYHMRKFFNDLDTAKKMLMQAELIAPDTPAKEEPVHKEEASPISEVVKSAFSMLSAYLATKMAEPEKPKMEEPTPPESHIWDDKFLKEMINKKINDVKENVTADDFLEQTNEDCPDEPTESDEEFEEFAEV